MHIIVKNSSQILKLFFSASEFEEAVRTYDNVRGKELQRFIESITSAENIMMFIGVSQLLSQYTTASKISQGASTFPTTVLGSIVNLEKKLQEQSEQWSWSTEKLEGLQLAPTALIIERMEKEGVFEPKLDKNVLLHHQRKKKTKELNVEKTLFYLQDSGSTSEELSSMGVKNSLHPSDSETPSLEVTLMPSDLSFNYRKQEVEKKLEKICKSLTESLNHRVVILGLIAAAENHFHNDSWLENEEEDTLVEKAKLKMRDIFQFVDSQRKGTFEALLDEISEGFVQFSKFSRKKKQEGINQIEKIYKLFYDSNYSKTEAFCDFFEYVEVRSYSEAICESLGSLMGNTCSDGRNLDPCYLNEELFVRINGPREHQAGELIREIAEFKRANGSEYRCKTNRLKFQELGSAVGNWRKEQEKKSHIPSEIFQ